MEELKFQKLAKEAFRDQELATLRQQSEELRRQHQDEALAFGWELEKGRARGEALALEKERELAVVRAEEAAKAGALRGQLEERDRAAEEMKGELKRVSETLESEMNELAQVRQDRQLLGKEACSSGGREPLRGSEAV